MVATVFFSWQSDTLDTNGKKFIESALKKAIEAISQSTMAEDDVELFEPVREQAEVIQEEIELDKDTKDEPGSPPIFETIREKIDKCALIVSDLTSVAERKNGQLIPNPNVLIEYGYAYRALT